MDYADNPAPLTYFPFMHRTHRGLKHKRRTVLKIPKSTWHPLSHLVLPGLEDSNPLAEQSMYWVTHFLLSCLVLSPRFLSLIILSHIFPSHLSSCIIIFPCVSSHHISRRLVLPCSFMPCPVFSHHLVSCRPVLPCPFTPCFISSCLISSPSISSCLMLSFPSLLLSCHSPFMPSNLALSCLKV